MAKIKQYGGAGMSSNFASIILKNDDEVKTLPTSEVNAAKVPLQGHDRFAVGSEAFCPNTGNAFMLSETGWIKL
jgi:hypothetical protein